MKTLGTTDSYHVNRSNMRPVLPRRARFAITMVFCTLPLLGASTSYSEGKDSATRALRQFGHDRSDRFTAAASAIWGTRAIRSTFASPREHRLAANKSAVSVVTWGHCAWMESPWPTREARQQTIKH